MTQKGLVNWTPDTDFDSPSNVSFSDLSLSLKVAVIFSYIIGIFFIISFLLGAIIGMIGQ